MTMPRLIERIQDWLRNQTDDIFQHINRGVAEAEETLAMLRATQNELADLRTKAAGWEAVVHECEKLLGCEDRTEEFWQSNLPNLVRDRLNEVGESADQGDQGAAQKDGEFLAC